MAQDWRTIEGEREKYAAYLCSREWAVLKQAVHERAHGLCERCGLFPISAVHHLTYERKYGENLEDLQGHCQHCHAFTHGKDNFDPTRCKSVLHYLNGCRTDGVIPAPFEAVESPDSLAIQIRASLYAIDQLELFIRMWWMQLEDVADLEAGIRAIDERLPFRYYRFPRPWYDRATAQECGDIYEKLGFSFHSSLEWLVANKDED